MQNQNQNKKEVIENEVRLEDKKSFVDPKEVIAVAGIKIGDKVADFGCGPGYFSLPASASVGESGVVYAFDVLPAAIEALESHVRIKNIDNIITKRVNLEKERATGLADESVDWVIIKDVLFQNKDKNVILSEAKRILKNGGRVLIMEWNENIFIGPDKDSRIAQSKLAEIIYNEGFIFKKQINAGDYHYVMIVSKV